MAFAIAWGWPGATKIPVFPPSIKLLMPLISDVTIGKPQAIACIIEVYALHKP